MYVGVGVCTHVCVCVSVGVRARTCACVYLLTHAHTCVHYPLIISGLCTERDFESLLNSLVGVCQGGVSVSS